MTPIKKTILGKVRGHFFAMGVAVFLVILASLAIGARRNMEKLSHLRDVKQTLLNESTALMKKNEALLKERDALHTKDYIEHVAREHFGMIKADETVFVVDEAKRSPLEEKAKE